MSVISLMEAEKKIAVLQAKLSAAEARIAVLESENEKMKRSRLINGLTPDEYEVYCHLRNYGALTMEKLCVLSLEMPIEKIRDALKMLLKEGMIEESDERYQIKKIAANNQQKEEGDGSK